MKTYRPFSSHKHFSLQIAAICFLLIGYAVKPAWSNPLRLNTDSCTHGDLNQNGLSYEVADFILFENYFLYGDSILNPDSTIRNAQICNSDINQDGLTLRVSDLVSLKRVITGDSPPLPKTNFSTQVSDTIYIHIQNQGTALAIWYSSGTTSDIGGIFLHLTVTGTVGIPLALDSNLVMSYNVSSGELRLLLPPSLDDPNAKLPAGGGSMLYIPFDGSLQNIEFQASTFTGDEMEPVVIFDTIDDTGDLNLNGLAYEIADLVLYENYFIYGNAALFSDPNLRQAQIRVSDVNRDGLSLRVADVVYMGRIINGDANPLPKATVRPQATSVDFQIVQEADRLLVSYNSPVDIAAYFLGLNFLGTAGDPVRLDSAQNIIYGGQVYPGELRFFLAGSFFDPSPGKLPAGSGPLLSIPFTGNLRGVEIQASDLFGQEVSVTGTYPIDNRGDLNADGYLTVADAVQELCCIFQSSSANCTLALADLNCDGTLTAADGVNIINAAFYVEAFPICGP